MRLAPPAAAMSLNSLYGWVTASRLARTTSCLTVKKAVVGPDERPDPQTTSTSDLTGKGV